MSNRQGCHNSFLESFIHKEHSAKTVLTSILFSMHIGENLCQILLCMYKTTIYWYADMYLVQSCGTSFANALEI